MNWKFIDDPNRGKLCEGRSIGVGGQFCKREGDTLKLIQPMTACKDFLNDIVYSEATGKPLSIYGQHSVKTGCFDGAEAYYAFCALPQNHCAPGKRTEEEIALLEKNLPHMEKLINFFEESFKAEGRTKIERLDLNRYLATIPIYWCKTTYLVSLFSLILRMAIRYEGGDVMAYMNGIKDEDTYNWNEIQPKIKRLMAGELPKQDLNAMSGAGTIHNCGIKGFRFP